jgi:type II restriction enzyme
MEISSHTSPQDSFHIPDKIRQQLQVLRDLGLLEFLGAGSYRLL